MQPDPPIALLPLGLEVRTQTLLVVMVDNRLHFEVKSMAGRSGSERQFGSLGLEVPLNEAFKLFQDCSTIDHIEGCEKVNLTAHAVMTLYDFFMDQTSKQRILTGIAIRSADRADGGIIKMGKQGFKSLGMVHAIGIHKPDQ